MALSETLAPAAPPVRLDADGVLRVGATRVTIDTLVAAYLDGATAEEIALRYDALSLLEVYGAIGYYLAHRAAVDEYLRAAKLESEAVRAENEARWPSEGLRERLLARRRSAA